ncbi:unnamed protein product [Parascedosporium putredinis]|uniref:Small nuclear ribonucleoprotein Prp3 C-terminal domain-containing protein n=1 Tax=Parascedosporium putredinis TaxID=1442378 RepID=A0A9P1H0U9_9PEZI|nr:unnamed protein product [Parascedosporium putredinis]CAI7993126.1 unnamed protein product [Parascedosporium putredinis]
MADDTGLALLPKDLLELQLGQIDLLMAIRQHTEIDEQARLLTLDLEVEDAVGEPKPLTLTLSVPMVAELPVTDPPAVKTRVHQPAWMSKSEAAQMTAQLPDEDILSVIEHVKDEASQHLARLAEKAAARNAGTTEEPIVRAWFYFPSISTREKRDDLVNHSSSYGLTGFLLAGKPGILCLEGGSEAIDDFMKFIKTESWGDIPPQHKKVSERYRERSVDLVRAFRDMQEITDMVGEKRGERANRSDMRALKAWLDERGLGEALEKILM